MDKAEKRAANIVAWAGILLFFWILNSGLDEGHIWAGIWIVCALCAAGGAMWRRGVKHGQQHLDDRS